MIKRAEMMNELQAGRELDALVAEEVMGWIRTTGIDMSGTKEYDPKRIITGWTFAVHLENQDTAVYFLDEHIPHYSTDITAAWEVWTKLPYPKQLFQLAQNEYTCFCGGDMTPGGVDYEWTATAETAPHAICLAALEAIGATP